MRCTIRAFNSFLLAALLATAACDEGALYPGEPPGRPSSPSPENGATAVSPQVVLSWICDITRPGTSLSYDVYLGTENPPPRVATGVSETSFNPGQLFPNSKYFWKITAYDDDGLVTEGPIWYFETVDGFWYSYPSPTVSDLNGVAFADEVTGWAVGDGGTILRYDGESWGQVSSPTTANLNGVTVTGNDGWAVGDGGTVLRLTGGVWSQVTVGTTADLTAVSITEEGFGWFVGTDSAVYRFNAGNWTRAELGETADLYCIAVHDEENAWAGGVMDALFAWNGESWSKVVVEPTYPPVSGSGYRAASVYQTPAGPGVWAAGRAVNLANFADDAWTFTESPLLGQINGMHISESANCGWAVGENGGFAFFDGDSWAPYCESEFAGDINAVFTLNKTSAWAAGEGGTLYRFTTVTPRK